MAELKEMLAQLDRAYCSVTEAAEIVSAARGTKVKPDTIRRLIRKGTVVGETLAGKLFVSRASLAKLAQSDWQPGTGTFGVREHRKYHVYLKVGDEPAEIAKIKNALGRDVRIEVGNKPRKKS